MDEHPVRWGTCKVFYIAQTGGAVMGLKEAVEAIKVT
jgi:hypothetical protein